MDPFYDASMPDNQRDAPVDAKVRDRRAPQACLLRAFSVLVAGILGWAVLQAAHPVLRMPKELAAVTILSPPEKVRQMMEFRRKADLWNPIMAMGLFGAAVGGSLAVGRGLAARSKPPLMLAAILGALAGAAFGCLGGWLGHLVSQMPKPAGPAPLLTNIELHLAVVMAMAGGIGLGIGALGGTWRGALAAIVAGLAAGALAGMAYPILAALLLPNANVESIIPEHLPERLLWILLIAGALGITLSAGKRGACADATP
jgi:hypothetical protein